MTVSRITTTSIFALMTLAATFAFTGCWESDLDEDFFCTDEAGDVCNPDFEANCSCVPFEDEEGQTSNPPDEEELYRYVLIEDLTDPVGGDSPGADLDAVSVTLKGESTEHFATSVEDFNIGFANNNYTDINSLLGKNDSNCEKKNFTALGGAQADGFVILGFNDGEKDVEFGSGAKITVYELGKSTCTNQPTWDDDPYALSVSAGNERGSFVEVGSGGPGKNTIVLP